MTDAPARPPYRIAVIGGGSAPPDELEVARAIGSGLATEGAVLVCGGLGGVMEAASRGASEAGGTILGILPGASPRAANRFVSLPIATGMGEARNALVVRAAEAVIAVGGEWGTLSEIALAAKMGVPVILVGRPPATGLDLPSAEGAPQAVAWALDRAREGRNSL